MNNQWINQQGWLWIFLFSLLCFPFTAYASFIESTMGTAVVNDATAIYFNPAALALLKNSQLILLNSSGHLHSTFTGQFEQTRTDLTLIGKADTDNRYQLPALYFAIPAKKVTVGLAVVANFLNKDIDGTSLLRYAQSGNKIDNIDVVPAIEYKVNDKFSVGAAMNISYARFLLLPTSGFPTLNIPDAQSRNQCDGTGIGGDIGFLFRPRKSTIVGLNYRSSLTYRLTGTSVLETEPPLVSNHYGFTFWTPARAVLSVNQAITPSFGMIGTVHRIQWSIFKEVKIHGIATQIGSEAVIVNANVPYHFRDTWLGTVGGYYQITPKWIIRIASSYNQTPASGNYQISNGDSIIVGASTGYEINKNVVIDAGYAHAFIQDQGIHITNNRSQINGVTHGFVDVFSLKLTFNIV